MYKVIIPNCIARPPIKYRLGQHTIFIHKAPYGIIELQRPEVRYGKRLVKQWKLFDFVLIQKAMNLRCFCVKIWAKFKPNLEDLGKGPRSLPERLPERPGDNV